MVFSLSHHSSFGIEQRFSNCGALLQRGTGWGREGTEEVAETLHDLYGFIFLTNFAAFRMKICTPSQGHIFVKSDYTDMHIFLDLL